jgi:hypothetical protein
MFFSDREKKVYRSLLGQLYDPVELNNKLMVASSGTLKPLLEQWWGRDTPDGERASAALQLAKVARASFGFKPFDQPDGVLDATVLESLYHFLEWLQGKD